MFIKIILFIFISFSVNSFSEIITFQDGKEINDEILSLNEKEISFKKDGNFKRDDISMIRFQNKEENKTNNEQNISKETIKKSEELFSRAKTLLKEYPDAQALILNDVGENTYRNDGTNSFISNYTVMVLKENAKQDFSQVSTYETKGRSRSKIIDVTVFCPNGKIYPFDPSKIKKAEPQSEDKFFEAGGQYLIYQAPGLDNGCILDYTIESETYNPYEKDFFFPSWGFQNIYPVYYSKININLPKNIDLSYDVKNFKGKFEKEKEPKISIKKDVKTYTWQASNIPPIIPENNMPPFGDISMNLQASILKNWDKIFQWTNNIYKKNSKANPQLRAFTLDLIKNCKTEKEKAEKIYHYVQKEIRYIAIKVGIGSGIGGYDANLTWERKWGCCVDKALLLSSMFDVAGIKNSPILIGTNTSSQFSRKVPEFAFNHAISVAYIDGKKVFLDSTNYDYKYPEIASFDYGVYVLNIFANKIDYIPSPKASENAGFYDFNINFSTNNEILVSEKLNYKGSRQAEVRGYYRGIKENERKNIFENMLKSISPKAKLLDFSINNTDNLEKNFYMTRSFSVTDYAQKAGDISIFQIPDFEISSWELNEVSLNDRKYPLQRSIPVGSFYTYNISIPKNTELISIPKKVDFSNDYVSFKAGCEKKSETEIFCFKNLEKKTRIVPVKDYQKYKEVLEKAAHYTKENIFFKTRNIK